MGGMAVFNHCVCCGGDRYGGTDKYLVCRWSARSITREYDGASPAVAVPCVCSGVGGSLCFTRPWALRYFKPRLVKTNFEENIGQNVCVTEAIDNLRGTGTAVCRGQEWTARAYVEGETFDAGTIVKVKEIRGVTMYVVKSEQMPERTADE